MHLAAGGGAVEADVRDSGRSPHHVSVRVRDGVLDSRCSCATGDLEPCQHAVAAVEAVRFPRPVIEELKGRARSGRRAGRTPRGAGRILARSARSSGWVFTREERMSIAREEELQDRRTRARTEQARVSRLSGRGGPPRFRVTGRKSEAAYTVVLRGEKADRGSCTCPDYSKSELGTCKHIERARNWFSKRKKRLPRRVLSVWWRPREWHEIVPDPLREIRLDAPAGESVDQLGGFFDQDGWLLGSPAGVEPAEWARQAVSAAEDLAAGRGWTWDLDAAVGLRIDGAAEEARSRGRLAAVDRGSEAWQRVVPALGLRLHPYQEDGALFLTRRGRAFLADDMGLGKTIQAIAAGLLLRRTVAARRCLVVCPASLKHQWRREIHKACGEHAVVLEASRSARPGAYRRWREGFLILNYEIVLRDLELIRRSRPDLVILDEAQRIKNWDTKTAKAVKTLDSPYAFILTGTPLENRLVELHSLVEFLHARVLGPRWRLFPFHAVTDPEGRVLAYEGLDVLRRRLDGVLLRREREAVLDQLPERTDNTFWTDMAAGQRRAYRRHASRVATLLGRRGPLGTREVRMLLQGLTTMRILCNAWAQYAWSRFEERVMDPRPATDAEIRALQSPKLEEFGHVLEDLLDESESKVVVFSQWERMLRLAHFCVRELLESRGERASVFHGGLDGRSRRRILEEFRESPETRVLFSTDAGGLGLNLQDSASIVVNLEVPWNPAVLEQRVGRVHRMGQRESVRVLHFVTRGAIEERVRHVVETKRALFNGLLVDALDRVTVSTGERASVVERVRQLIDSAEDEDALGLAVGGSADP